MKAWRSALLLLVLAAGLAQAGRPCEEQPLSVQQVERGMNLAQATAAQLDASGAQVVLLARAGQDLGKYGLQWSHVGFAYRDPDARAWRVLHKLNHCGTANAALYRQGLGEFFMDRPVRYEAAYSVLQPELQAALLPLLRDNGRAARLDEPRYSMLSYAWGTRYQQSNQWALETLAMAASLGVAGRREAQAWLRSRDYQPTDLRLSTFTRLGARISMANVAFDDHPADKRFSGHIETITADSMFNWLARSGLGRPNQMIKLGTP